MNGYGSKNLDSSSSNWRNIRWWIKYDKWSWYETFFIFFYFSTKKNQIICKLVHWTRKNIIKDWFANIDTRLIHKKEDNNHHRWIPITLPSKITFFLSQSSQWLDLYLVHNVYVQGSINYVQLLRKGQIKKIINLLCNVWLKKLKILLRFLKKVS